MKNTSVRIIIFISGVIGSLFSFFYLIHNALEKSALNSLESIASIVNYFLFFGALLFVFLAFFYHVSLKYYYGIPFIILGLAYLLLSFSFNSINFIYLIPLGTYLLSGIFILSKNEKRKKK